MKNSNNRLVIFTFIGAQKFSIFLHQKLNKSKTIHHPDNKINFEELCLTEILHQYQQGNNVAFTWILDSSFTKTGKPEKIEFSSRHFIFN